MAKKKSASQEGFEIAEGLDGVRLNPSMYLGELGDAMAYRVIKEEVDNSYDEHIAGRNSYIEVVIDYDNDFHIVADAAGGIPTDFKKLKDGTKETIMTAAFTRTHAGGKFNDKSYKTSAGTHGVGVAAANAVSEEMRVWSTYNGKLVHQAFSKGEITTKGRNPIKVKSVDKDVTAHLALKKIQKYGTIIATKLDQTVVSSSARRGKKLPKGYEHAKPDQKFIATWLRNVAMLNPGLKIVLTVVEKKKSNTQTFENKKGLEFIVKDYNERHELSIIGKPFTFKTDYITVACCWTDAVDNSNFNSFVNVSPTAEGGWHVVGFNAALANALKPFMKKTKGKSKAFTNSDLLIGLSGVFDFRMHGASYTSQVKDKLASRVDTEVKDALQPALEEYFEKNKTVAKNIIKRAEAMSKGRDELSAVVKSMSEVSKKQGRGSATPAALAVAPKAKPHERELFVVEGDSAAGTAVDARNPEFQEVLGAGGKPLNAIKASLAKILSHKEVMNFLLSVGADVKTLDPKDENPKLSTEKLRVNSIIFLVDPDPDGGHIAVLFLAVIYRILPDLFREGRVYCVNAPLYAAVSKGKLYGGKTFKECRDKAPSSVKDKEIVRIKGWGEVDETFLEPIAFDHTERNLIRINPFKDAESEKLFKGIVGEDASYRRQLLGLED